MSVHKENGRWRVKYRVGGRQRSRMFDREGDAVTFDSGIKRRRQLGPVLAAELDRETMTLRDDVERPWLRADTLPARGPWTLSADDGESMFGLRAGDRRRASLRTGYAASYRQPPTREQRWPALRRRSSSITGRR